MSEEQLEYDPEWTLATLNDAKEALEDLIAQVEDSPEEVKEILEENIANVYAKLNYAFNSAKDGPDALLSMPDDELVAFPSVLPLKHKVEFEEEDEEKPDEVQYRKNNGLLYQLSKPFSFVKAPADQSTSLAFKSDKR